MLVLTYHVIELTSLQSIAELISLILIFIVVLVVCYATTKFVAGKQIAQKKAGNFEVIETFSITQGKYLQLVRMGSKYVVISVTKEHITYITELDESEVCQIQKNMSVTGKSFKEVLSGFSKKAEEHRE